MAVNKKDTASPASTKRSGPVWIVRVTNARTVIADTNPPTKAAIGSVQIPRKSPVKVITRTAPAAAPEDSPNKKGSAKSFRVAVCKRAPTIASPLPTIEARTMRGNRKSIIILVIGLLAGSKEKNAPKSLPSNAEKIVSLGMLRPP